MTVISYGIVSRHVRLLNDVSIDISIIVSPSVVIMYRTSVGHVTYCKYW